MFVDESGDTGTSKKSTCHFVIAALSLPHPLILDKVVKRMRRIKFKTELSGVQEIKAIHSSTSIKKYMISMLNEIKDVNIIFVGINKKKYLASNPENTFWMIYSEAMNKFIASLDPKYNYDIKSIKRSLQSNLLLSRKPFFPTNH